MAERWDCASLPGRRPADSLRSRNSSILLLLSNQSCSKPILTNEKRLLANPFRGHPKAFCGGEGGIVPPVLVGTLAVARAPLTLFARALRPSWPSSRTQSFESEITSSSKIKNPTTSGRIFYFGGEGGMQYALLPKLVESLKTETTLII